MSHLLFLDLAEALLHQAEDYVPSNEPGNDLVPAERQLPGSVPGRVHDHWNRERLEEVRVDQHRWTEGPALLDAPERAGRQRGPRDVAQRRLNAAQQQKADHL